MFAIFDRLDAQFQTSKNPKTNYRLFLLLWLGQVGKLKRAWIYDLVLQIVQNVS